MATNSLVNMEHLAGKKTHFLAHAEMLRRPRRIELVMATDRVEEVAHPLGDDER